MSDIFISYKSENRPRAKIIAEALEQQGYSVWWDRTILPGKSYDKVIEEALDAALCVMVLWSREAVLSDWVKEEASEGLKKRSLVPVLIDDVEIPLGFRRIQAAQLIDWEGTLPNTEFDMLLKSIAEIVGRPPTEKTPSNELKIIAQPQFEEGKNAAAIGKLNEDIKFPENKIAIIESRKTKINEKLKEVYNFCQNCGQQNEDKLNYCIHCGENLCIN